MRSTTPEIEEMQKLVPGVLEMLLVFVVYNGESVMMLGNGGAPGRCGDLIVKAAVGEGWPTLDEPGEKEAPPIQRPLTTKAAATVTTRPIETS